MKTKKELLTWCESRLGTPYVYAAKGQVVTESLIQSWTKQYPTTFTPTYIVKARKFIGQYATDCSGLISWLTGIVRGSSQYKDTATAIYPISQLDESMIGYALWRSGHIAIYVGNGYCIEAKGIDYGTVKTKVSSGNFTHVLKLCDIDYTEVVEIKTGWQQDNQGWRYVTSDGSFAREWLKVESVWYYLDPGNGYMVASDWVLDKGHWYYFNSNGSLFYGWLLYKNRWLYLDKDGEPEGAAVTGFHKIKYDGSLMDFHFDKEGYMSSKEFMVIPDASGALAVVTGSK